MASHTTSATSPELTQPNSTTSEVWDATDDLATIVDPAERRRVQNRLHQRLYRRRRHNRRIESVQAADSNSSTASIGVSHHNENTLSHPITGSVQSQIAALPLLLALREPAMRQAFTMALQSALTRWSLNAPQLNDLPTVARLNAFDALFRNAMVLQIPTEFLESDDGISLFNVLEPNSSDPSRAYPGDLAPTALQRTIVHHPWLDLLPIPRLRDNILRSVQAGDYDENFLCDGICCDLLTTDWSGAGQLIIWGDPWDANNWEFGEEFFRNWGFLLDGCTGTLNTTNYWREKRGEMRLDFVMN